MSVALRFSALRHAVKLKHEIELVEVDILEFMECNLSPYIRKGILDSKQKELQEKKIELLRFVEQNSLQEIIFKKY